MVYVIFSTDSIKSKSSQFHRADFNKNHNHRGSIIFNYTWNRDG